jgi:hypothetical protein
LLDLTVSHSVAVKFEACFERFQGSSNAKSQNILSLTHSVALDTPARDKSSLTLSKITVGLDRQLRQSDPRLDKVRKFQGVVSPENQILKKI